MVEKVEYRPTFGSELGDDFDRERIYDLLGVVVTRAISETGIKRFVADVRYPASQFIKHVIAYLSKRGEEETLLKILKEMGIAKDDLYDCEKGHSAFNRLSVDAGFAILALRTVQGDIDVGCKLDHKITERLETLEELLRQYEKEF